ANGAAEFVAVGPGGGFAVWGSKGPPRPRPRALGIKKNDAGITTAPTSRPAPLRDPHLFRACSQAFPPSFSPPQSHKITRPGQITEVQLIGKRLVADRTYLHQGLRGLTTAAILSLVQARFQTFALTRA